MQKGIKKPQEHTQDAREPSDAWLSSESEQASSSSAEEQWV